MITICSVLPSHGSAFNANFAYAMAVDPHSGIVTDTNLLEPDFLLRKPNIFKAGKKETHSLGIMKTLSGPCREEFLQGMKNEIQELKAHGTWTITRRSRHSYHEIERWYLCHS